MDAKGQLMLVEVHFKAETSVHPSVKAFKKDNTSPFLCCNYMACCICISLKSD